MCISIEELLHPISKEHPAGQDVRYSPAFEELQAEIDKRSNITGSARPNWQVVVDLASGILRDQGKDLLVAAYLAHALCCTHGLQGFKRGTELLEACCAAFWNSMHPTQKRMQGRIKAIDWWMETSGDFLRSSPPLTLPANELENLRHVIESFEDILQTYHSDFPSLIPLLTLLERLGGSSGTTNSTDSADTVGTENPTDAKEQTPPTEAAPPPPASSGSSAPVETEPAKQTVSQQPQQPPSAAPAPPEKRYTVPSEEVPVITSDEDCARAEAKLHALTGAICNWSLPLAPDNPYYYCLARNAAWSEIHCAPEHVGGKTALEPAEPSFREFLQDLYSRKEWEDLLIRSELMLQSHPYWLDLCRYVDECQTALGERYALVRSLCSKLTLHFLQCAQGLEMLSYADGSPFADGATRDWLDALRLGKEEAKGHSIDNALNSAREKALSDIRTGDVAEAATRIQEHMDRAECAEERFRWRLLLAQVLNEGDQTALARIQFDILLEQIDRYSLDVWDEKLALDTLSAAYAGMHASDSESITDIRTALLHRISRISPATAVCLAQGKG